MKPIPTIPSSSLVTGILPEFVPDPPEYLAQAAAKYGPIVRFRLFHLMITLVADPALIQEVLVKKAADFPKDPRDIAILSRFIGRGLVTTVGAEHKKQRQLAQPAFHGRRIEAYADTMANYAIETARSWAHGESRNMASEMEKLTMYIVVKTLFDLDKTEMAAQAGRIGEAIHELQLLTNKDIQRAIPQPAWLPSADNRRRRKYRPLLDDTINDIIRSRRGESADRGDLLSMFLQARTEDGQPLSDQEIRDQLITIFVAGHETTSNALTWSWYYLSQNPAVAQRLHAEVETVLSGRVPTLADLKQLTYTEQVLKESMRIQPPVWILNVRQASSDVQIGDYMIKKGSRLFISPYAMHHHPTYFPDPQRFDPERFSPENEKTIPRYAYFPFGGGPRVCIGSSFAMMEAKLILAAMVQHSRFTLVPDQQIEPLPLVTTTPKYGLQMTARPHQPAAPQPEQSLLYQKV